MWNYPILYAMVLILTGNDKPNELPDPLALRVAGQFLEVYDPNWEWTTLDRNETILARMVDTHKQLGMIPFVQALQGMLPDKTTCQHFSNMACSYHNEMNDLCTFYPNWPQYQAVRQEAANRMSFWMQTYNFHQYAYAVSRRQCAKRMLDMVGEYTFYHGPWPAPVPLECVPDVQR